MPKKWIYWSSFIALAAFSGFKPVTPSKNFIPWSAAKPVQWSDFKGKPAAGSREAALTASSIEFSYETNGQDKLRWQVLSKFYPELSWSLPDHRSELILQHERLHFDITELYARILRKRLLEEIRSVKDIPKFKSITKAVMDDWNETQQDYDEATKHSIDQQKQAEWNLAIAERLQELEAFTATSFTLGK